MITKKFYFIWFALALVNLIFAISGRGNLHYLIAALFLAAGVVAWRSQLNQ